MKTIPFLLATLTCLVPWQTVAAERDMNLLPNPGFEEQLDGKAKGWAPLNQGYELTRDGRDGGWCVKCQSDSTTRSLGATRVITFDPPVQQPLLFSAWSTTKGMEGHDYSAFINVFYADGTSSWGNRIHFPRLTNDWGFGERVFAPGKPVNRVVFNVSLERAKGTVWFDDVRVALAPHKIDRATVWGGFTGDGRMEAHATSLIPSTWRTRILHDGREVFCQQGDGLEQRISWNGLDPQGARVPQGKCSVVFEATDTIRGATAVLTKETSTKAVHPGANYGVWTENSMTRVLPRDLPGSETPAAEIHLSAARNESESAQIVLLPSAGAPLRNVRVASSDLAGPGGARIAARHVQWHVVGYVRIGEQTKGHPYLRPIAPGWWPDPLLPVRSFDVEPGWSQPVWITVQVPEGTPPGAYTGSVTLSADNNPDIAVPLSLTVYDFTLPVQGHLKNTFALMQGYLEKVYGREQVTPQLRQAYGDFMLAHRLNPDDITRTDLPFPEDLEHYRERGLNTFNVLNLVEPRKGAWNCFSPVSFYTPAFKQSLMEKLDPYVADLRKRGLADRAYLHGFDERPGVYFPVIREYFGMVKERYGLPTLTTAKIPQDPKAMRDLNVDWLCPLSDVYSFEAAERCRAEGLQVWTYVCLGPRFPFANFLADDPLIEARVLLWQAFHQKLDGFLYWGVNVWWHLNTEKPIVPEKGLKLDWSITTRGMPFLHGDGVLIYPLPDGPAGSIRLANLRDGLEDYEYLWALGKQRGDLWSARADCEAVTTALSAFTRDPAVIQATREKIARELKRTDASPNSSPARLP